METRLGIFIAKPLPLKFSNKTFTSEKNADICSLVNWDCAANLREWTLV